MWHCNHLIWENGAGCFSLACNVSVCPSKCVYSFLDGRGGFRGGFGVPGVGSVDPF